MKIDRHGRAKVLTQAEIRLLFNQGLTTNRDRALFGVCLFTAGCVAKNGKVNNSTRENNSACH